MINRIAGMTEKQQEDRDPAWPINPSDVKQFIEPVENYVTQNPAAALAVAFCIGVGLAWWIKRR